MKPPSYSIAALAATMLLLTACNNSTNNNGFGTNCGGPPAGFQVLHPISGATHVNPAVPGVFVAANPALPSGNQYNLLAVSSSGAQQYTGQFAQYTGALPNPHASPSPGSTIYVAYFPQAIGPLQSVNLLWNNGGSGCTPAVVVSSFTTSP